MLTPKANFWAEVDGQVVFSDWRIALLEAIDEMGSITGAAHRLDIGYKLAWERIHEMEERLGQQLVDAQVGGVGGGGARLTPAAQDYVRRWHQFNNGLADLIRERFDVAFGPS